MIKYKYECLKCKNYKTNRKADYTKHINRKFDCKNRCYESNVNKKNNQCPYCKNNYSRSDYIPKHILKCSMAPNINITNNNNIEPITLCIFGKDDIRDISAKEMIQICTTENNIYEELVKIFHCNPLKKNHHNIYCPDRKSNDIVIFTNNPDTSDGWEIKRRKITLIEFIQIKTNDINNIIEILKKYLKNEHLEKINEQLIFVDGLGKSLEIINYTIRDISKLLYSHKDLIIKTRKESNKNKNIKKMVNNKKSYFKNGLTEKDVLEDLNFNGIS